MILKEHNSRHTTLSRPAFGNYNRNEFSFVGGTCEAIKELAGRVIGALSAEYKLAYIDSVHENDIPVTPGALAAGATVQLTAHQNYQQLNYNKAFNQFDLRDIFAFADLAVVNGNHHQAKWQVIIIDEKKRGSLQKKIDQLTDVRMILLAGGVTDIFDFIKAAIPGCQDIPVYDINDTEKIVNILRSQLIQLTPVLNGLVLTGGKSRRMGFDKGKVRWHGKEQRYYAADLLKKYCEEVFISCREDQMPDVDPGYNSLTDTFTGLGPYGGILSAFREQPDKAWLVVACDLPLLDEAVLDHLIANRQVKTMATAYQSTFNDFPEPLITIWEPKSYPVLLSFLAQGYSCPRKVLINSEVTLLQVPRPAALTNVNTPQEFEEIKKVLNHKMVQNES